MSDIVCVQEVRSDFEKMKHLVADHIHTYSTRKNTIHNYDFNLYYFYMNPSKTYFNSGVGIFSKRKPLNIHYDMNNPQYKDEGRVIAAEYTDYFVVNVYVPQSGLALEKLPHRLAWDRAFFNYVKFLSSNKNVIICGDFNVAANPDDFYFQDKNIRFPSCTVEERNNFYHLLNSLNYCDIYHKLNKNRTSPAYTFWSFQHHSRAKNHGMRLDYFLTPKSKRNNTYEVYDCNILPYIPGSDHCPIILAIK